MTAAADASRQYWAVARHQAEYVRCIDDEGARNWPDFFTADCMYVVTNDENYRAGLEAGIIYANNRAMLKDRIASLYKANLYEQHSYRHLLGQPGIGKLTGNRIDCQTNFLVVRTVRNRASQVFASGRYIDQYQMQPDATVLLSKRIVVCDSRIIDTLLAIPL